MRKSDQLAGNHIAVWEFIGLPPSAGGGQDDEEQECDAEGDREQSTSGNGGIPSAGGSCVWLGSVGQEESKVGLGYSAGVLAVTIAVLVRLPRPWLGVAVVLQMAVLPTERARGLARRFRSRRLGLLRTISWFRLGTRRGAFLDLFRRR